MVGAWGTAALAVTSLVSALAAEGAASDTRKQSNIVFILSDDQDLHLNSLAFQPAVAKHFGEQGTFYRKHFCTIALCCPSRVSLLTGKLAHNTNVTDIAAPYGGYTKFASQGLNDKYLPVWLQEAGYGTYYTGKLMNGHSTSNWDSPLPGGWNETDFLLDPRTYSYWNSTFQHNKNAPANVTGYSTDLVAEQGLRFIDSAHKAGKPFFVGLAPVGPHGTTVHLPGGGMYFTDPVPAERHMGLFPDAIVPRGPSFNPETPQGASWILERPRANETQVDYNDEYYRNRLRSLQSVDDLVDSVIAKLTELDLLDDTYIVYTTDNGYHIGQHRLPPGKSCAYEEDYNIPFFIRGPGIPKGKTVDVVTTHTDLAPTFFEMAGLPLRDDFDGAPMPLSADAVQKAQLDRNRELATIEYWGRANNEGDYAVGLESLIKNNTYKSLRITSPEYNLQYTVWCTNEHELYDLNNDPYETVNLLRDSSIPTCDQKPIRNRSLSQLTKRLDALVLVLKSCKGTQCTNPYGVLHPDGNVRTLRDALAPRYDKFYAAQPSVSYTACEQGYLPGSEGPMKGFEYYGGTSWAEWT